MFGVSSIPITVEAYIEPVPLVEEIKPSLYTSCVTGVRTRLPSLPKGDAKDLLINTLVPSAGIVVKFDYDHISYIEGTYQDENGMWLHLFEYNYEPNKASRRIISASDPAILGYFNPYEG